MNQRHSRCSQDSFGLGMCVSTLLSVTPVGVILETRPVGLDTDFLTRFDIAIFHFDEDVT